ncbi:hypothetical protein [Calothrix sp. 336/3]|uniref:hypothetical protein n=1 Tax=Calothrix sp. 336/3 TaxID=1337936 RepID=UPI00143B9965|nr:hypothetical protein [Calothrix sp. 336/3]
MIPEAISYLLGGMMSLFWLPEFRNTPVLGNSLSVASVVLLPLLPELLLLTSEFLHNGHFHTYNRQ